MNTDETESGFRSENTFSFGESENEPPRGESGMMRLINMEKDRKKEWYKFHVMEQKVILYHVSTRSYHDSFREEC